ncbi:MAG TPA: endo-1,4-beta-xylanase [Rhizomicrobium sp.]|jgi:endo-1,4-beta-xylanase
MITRRRAMGLSAAFAAFPASAEDVSLRASDTSLRALAAAKGILFGSAAATYELRDTDFTGLLPHETAILVPEYEMKREVTEPAPGSYDFSGCDALLGFAAAHGLKMRGHPLVWHWANPKWLEEAVRTKRDARLLTDYVARLVRRYRGRIHSYDVVNEALVPPDEGAGGWRPCFWLDAFGPAYLDLAFHAAHEADPDVPLIYNDFGCEQGTPANDRFRRNTLDLLDGLLKRGVPVQGLGLQGHLSAFGAKADQRKLRAFLDEIEVRKLTVLITELDVDDEGGPGDIALRDQAVADEARRFLDVALDCRATSTVLTWGLSDRYADPPQSLRLKLTGWQDRRLPYDRDLRAKPLRTALTRAFQAARPRLEPVKASSR